MIELYYMSKYKLHTFCMRYKEYEQLKPEDQTHIVDLLTDIITWYNKCVEEENHQVPFNEREYGNMQLGHFLTAIVKNNFIEAVCNSDGTLKDLKIFAHFIYNYLPQRYIRYAKEL